jgi:hypothetical protein
MLYLTYLLILTVSGPLRRPEHRWEDNIKMELGERGWKGVNWIHLAQNWEQWWAFVNM